tara:strand:- start:509 stop:865 length:357 start_codon:yes stop_codon:yes gene_type:complete
MTVKSNNQNNEFSDSYDENGLWGKVRDFSKKAGKDVIEKVVQLYYTLQASDTPTWAKGVIIGALGYFISPIDAIPDITPVVGFTDDLGVLTAAIATVATYITDDIKKKANNKMKEWFN